MDARGIEAFPEVPILREETAQPAADRPQELGVAFASFAGTLAVGLSLFLVLGGRAPREIPLHVVEAVIDEPAPAAPQAKLEAEPLQDTTDLVVASGFRDAMRFEPVTVPSATASARAAALPPAIEEGLPAFPAKLGHMGSLMKLLNVPQIGGSRAAPRAKGMRGSRSDGRVGLGDFRKLRKLPSLGGMSARWDR